MAEGTQQHPLKTYFYVWTLLFVFIMWHESYWTLIVRKIYFAIAGS